MIRSIPALLLCSVLLAACGGGDSAPSAPSKAVAPPADPAVAELYNRSCRSCHSAGGTGAPLTGDAAAWAPRLAQGREILLDNTIGGFQGMPPMGMCMDCSEDQFVALIEYMAQAKLP